MMSNDAARPQSATTTPSSILKGLRKPAQGKLRSRAHFAAWAVPREAYGVRAACSNLYLKKCLLDIRSRGLRWFGCHFLPPFSRRFGLSTAPKRFRGCGQAKTARKGRDFFGRLTQGGARSSLALGYFRIVPPGLRLGLAVLAHGPRRPVASPGGEGRGEEALLSISEPRVAPITPQPRTS